MECKFFKLKPFLLSCGRIAGMVIVIVLCVWAGYWLWSPGRNSLPLDSRELKNGIWLGHGWFADDAYFRRNPNRKAARFHDPAEVRKLLRELKSRHIHYVYPHMCPAQPDGSLPGHDPSRIAAFLDAADESGIQVIPWIGGVLDESARIHDSAWRKRFCTSVGDLLAAHPRIAGVQINVEPLPDGDAAFLKLLAELKPVLAGKILSVAAYPPPTWWHPFPNVHWSPEYLRQTAGHADQLCVMMYDTALRYEKFYIALMRSWTCELINAVSDTRGELLFGLPAYDDADTGYHNPGVENLHSALSGCAAGLAGVTTKSFTGFAIYCEWEMTPEKWSVWDKFLPDQENRH